MPRIIVCKDQHPVAITIGNETKHICMCGLSKNKPLCDGSHHKTKSEDSSTVYVYHDDQRVEMI